MNFPGGSLTKLHPQTFVPVVATQFPATSPFPMARNSPMSLRKQNLNVPRIPEVHGAPPVKNKPARKNTTREVKFETHKWWTFVMWLIEMFNVSMLLLKSTEFDRIILSDSKLREIV